MKHKTKKLIKIIAEVLAITLVLYALLWWPSKAMQAQDAPVPSQEIEEKRAEEQTAEVLEVIQELQQETGLTESESFEGRSEVVRELNDFETEESADPDEPQEPETEYDELKEADESYEDVPGHEHKYYYAGYCENEGELWCCDICMDSIIKPCSHRHTYCADCGEEL